MERVSRIVQREIARMALGLSPGEIFAGRYQIVRRMAGGAMGEVYEVIHLTTNRRRALKIMLPHIVHSAELRARFILEARIAAQVDSEFIVDVSDAGVDEKSEVPFLVMELLQGEEIGKRLQRLGRFPPEEALRYLFETALALDKTHRASIVHRDLKPGNLFLAEGPLGVHVKVLDFGVAKIVSDGATQAHATGAVGTPMYMSPEQFRGGKKISAAADIYALGMIAYTFLVGEGYWSDELKRDGNVIGFAMSAVHGPSEPASARAARRGVTLPPHFDPWFARATAADPTARFGTAILAITALSEVLGLPLPAHTSPSLSGTHRPLLQHTPDPSQSAAAMSVTGLTEAPVRGHRTLVAVALTVTVLGVGGALAYRLRDGAPPAAATPGTTATTETQPAASATPVEPTSTAAPGSALPVVAPSASPPPPVSAASTVPLPSGSAARPVSTGQRGPIPAKRPRIYSPD